MSFFKINLNVGAYSCKRLWCTLKRNRFSTEPEMVLHLDTLFELFLVPKNWSVLRKHFRKVEIKVPQRWFRRNFSTILPHLFHLTCTHDSCYSSLLIPSIRIPPSTPFERNESFTAVIEWNLLIRLMSIVDAFRKFQFSISRMMESFSEGESELFICLYESWGTIYWFFSFSFDREKWENTNITWIS